ncbi:hypothetical protein BC936DRAFT_137024 [Jimgerdemannia flammicorona]|uniref:Zn(2)-C6 fungal-type domain-containing protein n=1 Tax=Jimgerdemannia flammicorona TaxID=994334 RepID=A0A433CY87_9FUNG|nr:hypothetical protein BC936DRAFT_137024 [Jimgerdemannia flammicorona]
MSDMMDTYVFVLTNCPPFCRLSQPYVNHDKSKNTNADAPSVSRSNVRSSSVPLSGTNTSEPASTAVPSAQREACADCRQKKNRCFHTNTSITPALKRRRSGGACVECKRLKKHCDGLPCSRCEDTGVTCEPQVVRPRVKRVRTDTRSPHASTSNTGETSVPVEPVPDILLQDEELQEHSSNTRSSESHGSPRHQTFDSTVSVQESVEGTSSHELAISSATVISAHAACRRCKDEFYLCYSVPCAVCKISNEKCVPSTPNSACASNNNQPDDSVPPPHPRLTPFSLAPDAKKMSTQGVIRSNIKLLLGLISGALLAADQRDKCVLATNDILGEGLWTVVSNTSDSWLLPELEALFAASDDIEALKIVCQLSLILEKKVIDCVDHDLAIDKFKEMIANIANAFSITLCPNCDREMRLCFENYVENTSGITPEHICTLFIYWLLEWYDVVCLQHINCTGYGHKLDLQNFTSKVKDIVCKIMR